MSKWVFVVAGTFVSVCVCVHLSGLCVYVCCVIIIHTLEDAPAPLLVLTAVAVETVSATRLLLGDHLTMSGVRGNGCVCARMFVCVHCGVITV